MFTKRNPGVTSSGLARSAPSALLNQSDALGRHSLRPGAPAGRLEPAEPGLPHAACAKNRNGRDHAHRCLQPGRSPKRASRRHLSAHGRPRRREPIRHAQRTARARRAPNAARPKSEKMRRRSRRAASSAPRAGGATRRLEGDYRARCAPCTIARARLQKRLPRIAPAADGRFWACSR